MLKPFRNIKAKKKRDKEAKAKIKTKTKEHERTKKEMTAGKQIDCMFEFMFFI